MLSLAFNADASSILMPFCHFQKLCQRPVHLPCAYTFHHYVNLSLYILHSFHSQLFHSLGIITHRLSFQTAFIYLYYTTICTFFNQEILSIASLCFIYYFFFFKIMIPYSTWNKASIKCKQQSALQFYRVEIILRQKEGTITPVASKPTG